ncbi:ribonuclease P protein subunit p40-like [Ornithodoros turicata]|uniref:ribonuclease P protein subunit p40-like n=1 Tax=Ornithodoros turicata TaxID=34597 RepID=UPI0031397E57
MPFFPALKRHIDVYAGDFEHSKRQHWEETIRANCFIHAVQLIVPGAYSLPDGMRKVLSAHEYQIVRSLPAKELIDYHFIEAFVKKGSIVLLSVGSSVAYGECVAITPDGQLHLSTQEETFQSLGIAGSLSSESSKTHRIYSSTVDLLRECFRPGKKNYDAVQQALCRSSKLVFDVAVLWKPPYDEVSPLSVGAYFSRKGYRVDSCTPAYTFTQLFSALVPKISGADELVELNEWLGAIVCGVPGASAKVKDEFLSTYRCPEPSEKVGQVFVGQWQGFFTSDQVLQVFQELRNHLKSEGVRFCGMIVHSYEEDPTSPLKKHHSKMTSRSRECTYVALADNKYIVFRSSAV